MEYQFNEAQIKWLEALESGDYKQTKGRLFDGKGYCCLGLLCAVTGEQFQKSADSYVIGSESTVLPVHVAEKALVANLNGRFDGHFHHIGGKAYYGLAAANDCGATFSEIAAFIRANPTAVFKE
jgi:hypothetical protein